MFRCPFPNDIFLSHVLFAAAVSSPIFLIAWKCTNFTFSSCMASSISRLERIISKVVLSDRMSSYLPAPTFQNRYIYVTRPLHQTSASRLFL